MNKYDTGYISSIGRDAKDAKALWRAFFWRRVGGLVFWAVVLGVALIGMHYNYTACLQGVCG